MTTQTKHGLVNRIRSQQAGHPSGPLGRLIGKLMIKSTSASNDRALELLDLKESQTVLEVGFGQGRTTEIVLNQGHRVLGIEVSVTMLRQATARNRKACRDGRAKLVTGGGKLIPFDENTADAAFSAHTIYFMDDPQLTLAEIVRVLRPGARFVLASRTGDIEMPAWMDPNIYRIPTSAAIVDMFTAAGFVKVVRHDDEDPEHVVHWFAGVVPS
jgi:arsenite methyltransferase